MSLLLVKGLNKINAEGAGLKDISFCIEEKGVYGFLGKTDSGKGLLCSVLAGACEKDSGSIIYKENELYAKEKQTAGIKRKIGYVPQKSFFDSDMTVFEVLDLLGKAKRVYPDKRFRQIKEALELTGLSGKRECLVEDLSLSERKRLSIAAALLGNPDVIIMDEPLQYLDSKQAEEIRGLIAMLGKKRVVLLFSARADDIGKMSDKVGFLHCGELILWEDTRQLMKKLDENSLGTLDDALCALTDNALEEN